LALTSASALLLLVAGCSASITQPAAPPPSEAGSSAETGTELHGLVDQLAHRDRMLDSMQADAVMAYTAGDRHVKAHEQIVAKRPDQLRVEASSPFGVALILAAHGTSLELFDPSNNKLTRGVATAEALNQYARIPMAPADAVTLLLGIAPESSELAKTAPNSTFAEGAMSVARWARGSSSTELGFQDGQLAMVREYGPTGSIQYEVRYSDYHDIGGIMFPYGIDADFPIAGSHLTLTYRRPIINGQIPASVFELSPSNQADANTLRRDRRDG